MISRAGFHARPSRAKLVAPFVALALVAALFGSAPVSAASADTPATQSSTSPDDWLGEVNLLRAMAGLLPVTEVLPWSHGASLHSQWMVYNDSIMHGETPGSPWYTPEGDLAGQRSNLTLSTHEYTNVEAVHSWMTVPFHGIGLIDPRLTRSGFGAFYDEGDSLFRYGAALDVNSDLLSVVDRPVVAYPVVWPSSGATVHLTSFGGNESPDPLTHPGCNNFAGPVGLPLYALFGSAAGPTTSVSVERMSGGAPVETLEMCWFDGDTYQNLDANHQNVGRSVLSARNAVVAMPRHPLVVGEQYRFTVVRGGVTATSTFAAGAEGVGTPVQKFSDVATDHPFHEEIEWMAEEGISTGYDDGKYQPGATLTRMAMSAFLYRFAGSPRGEEPACSSQPFSDVPTSHPFCGEIAWMADQGITSGYDGDEYRPSQGLSRMAMSAFLYRFAGSPRGEAPACSSQPFSDVPMSHPFCGEIAWMADEGISTGYDDGTYKPDATLTRMAMSAFLYRLAEVID